MRSALPLVMVLLVLAVITWSAGCTGSTSAGKKQESTPPAIESPATPVPERTGFGGMETVNNNDGRAIGYETRGDIRDP
jgi:hypothetical protein